MLKISGLSVAYGGLHALEDVSLEVAEGEFVTIMGPSGAGKSTLLAILGMYDHAWEGNSSSQSIRCINWRRRSGLC